MKPITAEEFIKLLSEEFEKRLQAKTSWGRNDLLLEFEKAKVSTLSRLVDMS